MVSLPCQYFMGSICIATGDMSKGMELIKSAQESFIAENRILQYAMSEFFLGEVNAEIAIGTKPSMIILIKNIGFLSKHAPFASNNAEKHFQKSIKIFKRIGAKCLLGMALLSLGVFYKAKNKYTQSQKCIQEAIELFQECKAEDWLHKAKTLLSEE